MKLSPDVKYSPPVIKKRRVGDITDKEGWRITTKTGLSQERPFFCI